MLNARKTSWWKANYEVSSDGVPITRWTSGIWRTGASFELDGRRYEVGANRWGSRYGMATDEGERVATADRVGRKQWTVQADGRTYTFERLSRWRNEQALVEDGRMIGSVRRVSTWRSDAVADLPTLPLPVQMFALVVVLTMWDQAAAAGA